jgi:transcriptional regulator with XRE-family HTH domain
MDVVSVHGMQSLARARRRELGLTQSQVVARAGLTRKWLSEFERGVASAAELPRVLRLLAALDLRLDVRSADPHRDGRDGREPAPIGVVHDRDRIGHSVAGPVDLDRLLGTFSNADDEVSASGSAGGRNSRGRRGE